VMEYVPGSDCAAMLRMYGCLPEGEGGREGEREGGSEGGKEEKRETEISLSQLLYASCHTIYY